MQATKRVKAPRKQRKRLYNAPAHLRHKMMASPLSPELVKSKGAKAIPIRKGDTVRILRGDHIGFEGKVSRVDLKRYRIFLEGLTREKVDGTNIFVSVHPSKVMIRSLKLDDKWRKGIIERKKEVELPKKRKKIAKAADKTTEKTGKMEKEKAVKKKRGVREKTVKKKPKPDEKEREPKTTKKPQVKRKATIKAKRGT